MIFIFILFRSIISSVYKCLHALLLSENQIRHGRPRISFTLLFVISECRADDNEHGVIKSGTDEVSFE